MFNKQNNNFARTAHLFVNIFADNVKMPNFAFYGEGKQATIKFYFCLFSLGIQLLEGSPTFDKESG